MKTIDVDIPRATCAVLGITAKDEKGEKLLVVMDEYFANFAHAENCPRCGEALAGMFGTFRWGMVNGEGACICGYPCRAIHRIMDGDDEPAATLSGYVLPYHPSVVQAATAREGRKD